MNPYRDPLEVSGDVKDIAYIVTVQIACLQVTGNLMKRSGVRLATDVDP